MAKGLGVAFKELDGINYIAMPKEYGGMGLTLMEYALVAEVLGASHVGLYVFGCQAPDAGNIEILEKYATPEQHEKYLIPLVRGEIRSCFSMTEDLIYSNSFSLKHMMAAGPAMFEDKYPFTLPGKSFNPCL